MSAQAKASKLDLRQRLKQRRLLLDEDAQAQAALALCEHLWAYLPLLTCGPGVIGVYVAARGELSLMPFIDRALAQGLRLAAPRVAGPGLLEFISLEEPSRQLQPGAYGLLEPQGEPIEPDDLGAALIPGVAFDLRGGRLGQGGGFYDRWLSAREEMGLYTLCVGVGYQWQLMDEPLPMEPHDHRMRWLATEQGVRIVS